MACNCGTKEEIDRLYRLYGEKLSKPSDNENKVLFWFKKILYFIATIIMYIIILPLSFIYVAFKMFWYEKPVIHIDSINLLKVFKLR